MAASVEAIVAGTASQACLARMRALAGERSEVVEAHGRRVLEISLELARRRGAVVDGELLACAAWLHDIGLFPEADAGSHDPYVVDGRRVTEAELTELGWSADRVKLAGDAVERHHELRPQWRRGVEVELMRRADLIDVSAGLISFGLTRSWLRGLFARQPRRGFYAGVARLLAADLARRPSGLTRIFLR